MMKTPLIYLLLCTICMSNVYGQQTNWVNLVYNGNEANHIAPDGDYIYVSTKKGYSVINRVTGNIENYDIQNTELLRTGVREILPGNNGKHYFNNNNLLTIKEGDNWDIYPAYSYFDLYNNPRNMRLDPNGELWMFGRGFIHYKGVFSEQHQPINPPSYFGSFFSSRFEIDNNGDFWFAFYENCLVHYDRTDFTFYRVQDSTAPSKKLEDLIIDGENTPWIATSDIGIIRLKDSVWEYYNDTTIGLPHNAVQEIEYHDGDIYGLLWGYPERQIFTYSEEGVLTVYDSTNTNLPLGKYSLFVVDDDGNMWFQVENDQGFSIVQFDGVNTTSYVLNNDQLLAENVQGVSAAPNGSVDIVNSQNGFNYINYENGVYTNFSSNLGFFRSVIEHNSGKLFYNGNGILRLNSNGVVDQFDVNNSGLPVNVMSDAQRDPQGNVWFVCDFGFVKYNGSTFTLEYPFDSGVLNNVSTDRFAIDANGDFWFVNSVWGYNGLYKFDGSSVDVFQGFYKRVVASNTGEIYTVKEGVGMYKYNGTTFQELSIFNNILYNVNDVVVNDNEIFIGIENGGIKHYDGVTLNTYNVRNSPILSNTINDMTVDGNGNLWMAFNGGISIFSNNQIVLDTDEHTEFSAESLTYIYPNPFDASFTLTLTQELEEGQIQITDIQGRVVHTQNIKELENSISLPSLNDGVYFYTVLQQGRILDQGKIIKR